jgi:hypothetical protein
LVRTLAGSIPASSLRDQVSTVVTIFFFHLSGLFLVLSFQRSHRWTGLVSQKLLMGGVLDGFHDRSKKRVNCIFMIPRH